MISNGLFEETNEQNIFSKVFYNYVLNFMNIMFNEKFFKEKFLFMRNTIKQKWKHYDLVHAINCVGKLTCMCACARACDHTRLREQYVEVHLEFFVKITAFSQLLFLQKIPL